MSLNRKSFKLIETNKTPAQKIQELLTKDSRNNRIKFLKILSHNNKAQSLKTSKEHLLNSKIKTLNKELHLKYKVLINLFNNNVKIINPLMLDLSNIENLML